MKEKPTDILQDPELKTTVLTGAPETEDVQAGDNDGDENEDEEATSEEKKPEENGTEQQKRPQTTVGEFTRSEEAEQHSNMSLKQILGGDILTGDWLKRQMGLIVMCCLFTIIYITNRYSAEQEIIEIERLKTELQEIKYRALTRSGELTVRSRQSQIEEYLKTTNDSTLSVPKEPPYRINTQTE